MLVHLKDFAPNDRGYSYLNFIIQYDSQVFDNLEYTQHSVYAEGNYTAGSEVDDLFQFNFQSPVDGSIYLGKIQVCAALIFRLKRAADSRRFRR